MTTKAVATAARIALLAWATTVPDFTIQEAAHALRLTYSQVQHHVARLCTTKQIYNAGYHASASKFSSNFVCVYSVKPHEKRVDNLQSSLV